MLAITQLNKRFGSRKAIDNLSLRIAEGETVAICGHNGAGKTTLLAIVAGVLRPSSGFIRIAGHDAACRNTDMRRTVGYLPENSPLYQDLTVEEHLIYRGRLKGLRGRRLRARLRSVIECCDLHETRYRLIAQLSQGDKQCAGVADILLTEPRLMLLDEPFAGLDSSRAERLADVFKSSARHGATLVATHRVDLAVRFSHKCLVLEQGHLAGEIAISNSGQDLVGQIAEIQDEFRSSLDRMVPS